VDSAITVEDASIQIDVKLWRIGITLPAVTVTGTTECRTPGAPHREVTPDLAAVFDQVVENAHRLALLADSFPHTMRLERRFAELKGDEQRPTSIDTLEVESTERWPYRPGNIVGLGAGARRGERVVRLPTLIDFADTAFVTHHCFWLAGRDTLEGERFVRMDFQPPLSLNATDVAGAAYLDSATYLIRYTVVRLTRPQRALPGLKSLVATSRFREVVPWILVADRIRAVREPRRLWEPDMVEEQLLIGVDFTRPLVGRP
jgi:hypothetical protein